MSETSQATNAGPMELEIARERTKQAEIVGWTAGVTGLGSVYELASHPEWPFAAGVAAVAAMVAFVCHCILKR